MHSRATSLGRCRMAWPQAANDARATGTRAFPELRIKQCTLPTSGIQTAREAQPRCGQSRCPALR